MSTAPVYSVTQVNQYIKGLLDGDSALSGLFVRGEISNYKAYPSGHHSFSLKDGEGAIRCVMFRRVLLDYQREKLAHGLRGTLGRERERFARRAATLDAISPLKVLGRGYAIPRNEDGHVVRSIREAHPGDKLELRMADGSIDCKVL